MLKSLIICVNKRANPLQPSCGARGSLALADQLEHAIAFQGLPIKVIRQKCLGMCENGPNLKLAPGGRFYNQVSDTDLVSLLEEIQSFCQDN